MYWKVLILITGLKGAILASQPIRAFVLARMTQKSKELQGKKMEKVLRTK